VTGGGRGQGEEGGRPARNGRRGVFLALVFLSAVGIASAMLSGTSRQPVLSRLQFLAK
jgi:hypothetical protein